MKKRKVILSLFSVFVVFVSLVIIIKKNNNEYIMYDGSSLAITIDGVRSNTFPSNTNKYHVDIECDNGVGEYLPDDDYNMKFTIKNITEDGAKCFIDFTTITDSNKSEYLINDVVKNSGTKIESTNNTGETDTSYRYTGKTPNNYVWFNNELWRIIGLIPVCLDSGCGSPTTSLVKIIRNESIGGISYDATADSYTGEWGNNTLYTLLNSNYYGKKNAIDSNYCYGNYTSAYHPVANCDYREIGISSDPNDYYGRMIENVYWNTGTSSASSSANSVYTTETAKQTVEGRIGLVSASDYGFVLPSSYGTPEMNSTSFSNGTIDNWLFSQSYEWTNINSSNNKTLYINGYGLLNPTDSYVAYVIRPVVYLDSSVYIISGEGTGSNPYILGM